MVSKVSLLCFWITGSIIGTAQTTPKPTKIDGYERDITQDIWNRLREKRIMQKKRILCKETKEKESGRSAKYDFGSKEIICGPSGIKRKRCATRNDSDVFQKKLGKKTKEKESGRNAKDDLGLGEEKASPSGINRKRCATRNDADVAETTVGEKTKKNEIVRGAKDDIGSMELMSGLGIIRKRCATRKDADVVQKKLGKKNKDKESGRNEKDDFGSKDVMSGPSGFKRKRCATRKHAHVTDQDRAKTMRMEESGQDARDDLGSKEGLPGPSSSEELSYASLGAADLNLRYVLRRPEENENDETEKEFKYDIYGWNQGHDDMTSGVHSSVDHPVETCVKTEYAEDIELKEEKLDME